MLKWPVHASRLFGGRIEMRAAFYRGEFCCLMTERLEEPTRAEREYRFGWIRFFASG
jgi:hypothetical protein